MKTKRDRRDAAIISIYYSVLAVLAVVVVWHWIFGGRSGFFTAVVCWSVLAVILLGLLNALGVFGRR